MLCLIMFLCLSLLFCAEPSHMLLVLLGLKSQDGDVKEVYQAWPALLYGLVWSQFSECILYVESSYPLDLLLCLDMQFWSIWRLISDFTIWILCSLLVMWYSQNIMVFRLCFLHLNFIEFNYFHRLYLSNLFLLFPLLLFFFS